MSWTLTYFMSWSFTYCWIGFLWTKLWHDELTFYTSVEFGFMNWTFTYFMNELKFYILLLNWVSMNWTLTYFMNELKLLLLNWVSMNWTLTYFMSWSFEYSCWIGFEIIWTEFWHTLWAAALNIPVELGLKLYELNFDILYELQL